MTQKLAINAAALLAVCLSFSEARAQSSLRSYALDEAVADALAHHPGVAASRAEEAEAAARVDEARVGLLPELGISAEINRSTANTVPGAFFPAPGFVPIAGAPRGKTLDAGVWQTGVAAWANWDLSSIARQAAAIDVALAGKKESRAASDAQRLEIAYRAADSFLLLLEAQERVRAANANVARAEVLVDMTKPLVNQNLRPGVDLARAQAELANAQIELARAEQAREVRRSQLAAAVGRAGLRVDAAPGALLAPVDESTLRTAARTASHPAVIQATAAAERAGQARRLIEIQYLPRVDLVASLWLRGSGIYGSPAAGLGPDVPNWAAGIVATWSILDIATIRARARAADASYAAAASRRDEVALAVSGELASASATVDGAVRVSQQTPAALTAARAAEQQALARYKSGLTPVVDVADAERVLAQAEIEDAVARLETRRALLLLARASGDLGPFLARSGGSPRRRQRRRLRSRSSGNRRCG